MLSNKNYIGEPPRHPGTQFKRTVMQFIKEIGKCKEENNSLSFKTQKQTKPNRL